MGAPLFSCLDYGIFGKGKVFSKICNLSNLVDIQRKHENDKRITYSDGLYTLFKKVFLLFHTALLKCFIYSREVMSTFYIVQQSSLSFNLFTGYLPTKNITTRNIILTSISFIAFAKEWTYIYRLVKLLTSSFWHYFL